jgi:hypothetical protein
VLQLLLGTQVQVVRELDLPTVALGTQLRLDGHSAEGQSTDVLHIVGEAYLIVHVAERTQLAIEIVQRRASLHVLRVALVLVVAPQPVVLGERV